MLAVTEAAAEAISSLTAIEGKQQAGGLRLTAHSEQEDRPGLAVAVAAQPVEGDEVVTSQAGAQVFLEPDVARYLSDKVLDVQQNANGQLSFSLREQD